MKKASDFGNARRNSRLHLISQAFLMVGLAIAINFLATKLYTRTDLSQPDRHIVSAETKKVLESLQEPVDVIVTITEGSNQESPLMQRLLLDLKFLLGSLEEESSDPGKIRVHYVNVLKQRGANEAIITKHDLKEQNLIGVASASGEPIWIFKPDAQDAKWETDKVSANVNLSIKLEKEGWYSGWEKTSEGHLMPTYFQGESKLLSAIRKVSRAKMPKVVFLKGHDEMKIDNFHGTRGLTEMESILKDLAVETGSTRLGSGERVPQDADIVIIASPQYKLDDAADALQGYLSDRRGNLLLLLDPVRKMKDHGLEELLGYWGLRCDDKCLVEPEVEKTNRAPYYTDLYKTEDIDPIVAHPIVENLAKNEIPLLLFPYESRGRPVLIDPSQASERVVATSLMTYSEASWAEKNWRIPGIADDPEARETEGNDKEFVSFAAVSERKVRSEHGIDIPGGKLAVFGNSTLFCNEAFVKGHGNRILFRNVIHWLLDERELLRIPPKPVDRFAIRLNHVEHHSVLYHLALIPGLVALVGLARRALRRDA